MPTKKKRSTKEILAAAKAHLRSKYIQGKWVKFDAGEWWDPDVDDGYSDSERAEIKKLTWDQLREYASKRANPGGCEVCSEGAIYYACAADGDETPKRAREIVSAMSKMVRESDQFPTSSIVDTNDKLGKEKSLEM